MEETLKIEQEELMKKRALELYHDPSFPQRLCDRCQNPYTGPAVYCSLKCALEDV